MTLRPASLAELAQQLAECHAASRAVADVDLAALAAVREHTPADLTVTAEGGLTLAALQAALAARGQWLPVDPPHADRVTIRQLLAENLSGPRRCGFGTIREHLIGLEAVLADGRVIHSGGKVVKNVAGYDLLKLFVGARDSLGIITAATFKVQPLPECELALTAEFSTLAAAWEAVTAIRHSSITPVILDLHNLTATGTTSGKFTVRLGFAGTRAEVDWQRAQTPTFQPDAEAAAPENAAWAQNLLPHTASVLPSKLPETLAALAPGPFLARAANGLVHHASTPLARPVNSAAALAQRLKDTFDPRHILPVLPS